MNKLWVPFILLFSACHSYTDFNTTLAPNFKPKHVILLLPKRGEWKTVSEAIEAGFKAANHRSSSPIRITVFDTFLSPELAYHTALLQKPDLIVGPLLKKEVQALSRISHNKIPILSLNYLGGHSFVSSHFYQFGLSPRDEVKQVVLKAKHMDAQSALILVPDTTWGEEIGQTFTQEWEALEGKVAGYLKYSQTLTVLTRQLQRFLKFKPPHTRRNDFDVIFLGATSEFGRQIKPLLNFYCTAHVPVYSTALIYDNTIPSHLNRDLDSIIFCDAPWNIGLRNPHSELNKQLLRQNNPSFKYYAKYYALGIDAFHIGRQLKALEENEAYSIEGTTGKLTLNEDRCIIRIPAYAQFRRGEPKALPQSIVEDIVLPFSQASV